MFAKLSFSLVAWWLLAVFFFAAAEADTLQVPGDYVVIQEAINVASPGDTIEVNAGIYVENIMVDKDRLEIRSASGPATTLIQPANRGHAVHVRADCVTISGFGIKNAGEENTRQHFAGVCFEGASQCMLANNILSDNTLGIQLIDSNHNLLIFNQIRNNQRGIVLSYRRNGSIDNLIRDNAIYNNKLEGIYLARCHQTMILRNVITDNGRDGISVNGRDGGDNIITRNTIGNNEGRGLSIDSDSHNNSVYLNNFVDNRTISRGGYYTQFYSPATITYTYDSGTHTSYLGNYWSSLYNPPQTALADVDDNGIADTVYSLIGGQDPYPLMKPFEDYTLPK